MSNHPLEGFRAKDAHHGGIRSVDFEAQAEVLTVAFDRDAHGDYLSAAETRYFRLIEVTRSWTAVES